ncbi:MULTISPECIES: GlcG/HbpS family heme-binding protein [Pusillimonas]|uniref:GlcG/HbpS family heme-binding protein n=1 Tax=Pusillimonas TaxID=305976 RepID=UPI000E59B8EE|nr:MULTISPECIES: heme-binding protein [Pusillimonas]MDX3894923.1 heme-binding protein [Pusillimonas sp.]TFL08777.1 hypothetical protein CSC67_20270 [Pusillimonas caeni]
MKLNHELVASITARAIEEGLKRGFNVSCALVDDAGRTVSVLRHADASWQTPEFALGKARLASAFKTSTGAMYARLQKERPLYGTMLTSLNARNDWMLAEGGAAIKLEAEAGENHGGVAVGAIGISGCFPATIDQEIADQLVEWVRTQV